MKNAFLMVFVIALSAIVFVVASNRPAVASKSAFNPSTDIVSIDSIPLSMMHSYVINNALVAPGTATDGNGTHATKSYYYVCPAGYAIAIVDAQPWYQVETTGQIQNEVFRIHINGNRAHEETRRAEPKGMSYNLRRAPVVIRPGESMLLEWLAAVGEPAPSVVSNFSFALIPLGSF